MAAGWEGLGESARARAVLVLLALCASAVEASAQDLPPAPPPPLDGRESERGRTFYEDRATEGEEHDGPVIRGGEGDVDDAPSDRGPRFVLREVRFNESAFLDEETLRSIAQPYVGRTIDFGDIQEMVRSINALYRERRLLTARAVVPPQRVEGGVLTIRLVEGRLGQLIIQDNHYTNEDYLRAVAAVEPGEVLDIPALSHRLRRFNAGGDIALRADLQPGEEFGETDVILRALEPPRAQIQVFADNTGSASTGEAQFGEFVLLRGLLGRGDHLSLYLSGAEGSLSGSVAYAVPLLALGSRLELSYSDGEIRIVQGVYSDLDITGDSSSVTVQYSQPVWLGEAWTWSGIGSVGRSESTTFLAGVPLSDTTIISGTVGALAEYTAKTAKLSARQSFSVLKAEDILGAKTESIVYRGGLSYIQGLTDESYGLLKMGWQYTPEVQLPASEVFQVGGSHSVRGRPQGELTGAKGVFLQAEWHWRGIPPVFDGLVSVEPYIFADRGAVWAESPKYDVISGAGVGVQLSLGDTLTGEVAYGYGFEPVLPDEDQHQVYLRLVWNYAWK